MKFGKRMLALGLSAGLTATALSGCYSKVKIDNYGTTTVATFGDQKIMLDEANYYVKMHQVSYDSSFYYYSYFYGFKNLKDMYESVADEKTKKTLWDTLKEDAMGAVYQTYVLCDHADDYNISLTDEDKEKIEKSVKSYFEEGDSGLTSAINISEEHLRDLLTRNAIAVKVHDYLVKDIDTKVDEAQYRHALASYIKVTEAKKEDTQKETTKAADGETKEAESTVAETTEAETKAPEKADLKAAAEEIKAQWEKEFADSKDYTKAANSVVEKYKDSKEITAAYTATANYAKPTVAEGETEAKASLQKYVWENMKEGEFAVYEDGDSTVYVVYCYEDDDPKTKQTDIDSELDTRRAQMFKDKWPDVVKGSPEWKVESRVYAQIKYAEIDYDEPTTAETTESETKTETTAADETKAEETTAGETTMEETAK